MFKNVKIRSTLTPIIDMKIVGVSLISEGRSGDGGYSIRNNWLLITWIKISLL